MKISKTYKLALISVGLAISACEGKHNYAQKYYYYTEAGEQRTIKLPDGSTVELNTDTQMHVLFDDEIRKVIVSRGQAFFDVIDTDKRPFVVEGGTGTAKVIKGEVRR